MPYKCPAYGKQCKKCKKMNHFARACNSNAGMKRSVKEVMQEEVDSYSSDNTEELVEIIKCIETPSIKTINCVEKAWYKTIEVENREIRFKLDTGAEVNIIALEQLQALGLYNENSLKKTNIILQMYGGFKLKPVGVINLKCVVNNIRKWQEFVIVKTKTQPLLGLNTCIELQLIKRAEEISVNDENKSERDDFIKRNKDVFSGIGNFKDKLRITLKEDAKPVARPPRRVPLSIRSRLKEKLCELERKKKIEKVNELSDWVSNIVVVEKTYKSLRICLDPHDLNKNIKKGYVLIPTLEEIQTKLTDKKYFTVLDLKDGFYQVKLDDKSSKLCTVFEIMMAHR